MQAKRLARINKHIQRTFGMILLKEADLPIAALVTIARVETTPNLAQTTIWLYINPVSLAPTVLAALKQQLYELQGALNRALDMRPLPRLRLQIDYGIEHAATIEQPIAELRESNQNHDPAA